MSALLFCKHCDKSRNCSKQEISPFVTKFSTLSVIIPSFSDIFHIFFYVFKVVCCRYVLCGKGLNMWAIWLPVWTVSMSVYMYYSPRCNFWQKKLELNSTCFLCLHDFNPIRPASATDDFWKYFGQRKMLINFKSIK